ncbi:MAG: UDP-N-acetylglucosamine pyrophosphorylase, partial [Planctomycetes bacterium]|nr:UDP-N-acetylglucosamine pyrophosphorylase [Planctomycetota bacterium]
MRYYAMTDLVAHGIDVPEAGEVLVDRTIPLEQISREGVRLHAGVRLEGPRTVVAGGVELGRDGPVVARNVGLGRRARIDRGSAQDCVLLDDAVLGPDAHVRGGTLLEEAARTAHAVGLKQTILMPFVTLGSQINFCDALMAGGRSRVDHSEVGSGFIHFNFTPFGATGDKATASLFGDVPNGVLLRSDRIFLGGAGGVVGPVRIGFGTVLAAGCVYRRDYDAGQLVYAEQLPARAVALDARKVRGVGKRLARTREYLGQLFALHAYYRFVRMVNETEPL